MSLLETLEHDLCDRPTTALQTVADEVSVNLSHVSVTKPELPCLVGAWGSPASKQGIITLARIGNDDGADLAHVRENAIALNSEQKQPVGKIQPLPRGELTQPFESVRPVPLAGSDLPRLGIGDAGTRTLQQINAMAAVPTSLISARAALAPRAGKENNGANILDSISSKSMTKNGKHEVEAVLHERSTEEVSELASSTPRSASRHGPTRGDLATGFDFKSSSVVPRSGVPSADQFGTPQQLLKAMSHDALVEGVVETMGDHNGRPQQLPNLHAGHRGGLGVPAQTHSAAARNDGMALPRRDGGDVTGRSISPVQDGMADCPSCASPCDNSTLVAPKTIAVDTPADQPQSSADLSHLTSLAESSDLGPSAPGFVYAGRPASRIQTLSCGASVVQSVAAAACTSLTSPLPLNDAVDEQPLGLEMSENTWKLREDGSPRPAAVQHMLEASSSSGSGAWDTRSRMQQAPPVAAAIREALLQRAGVVGKVQRTALQAQLPSMQTESRAIAESGSHGSMGHVRHQPRSMLPCTEQTSRISTPPPAPCKSNPHPPRRASTRHFAPIYPPAADWHHAEAASISKSPLAAAGRALPLAPFAPVSHFIPKRSRRNRSSLVATLEPTTEPAPCSSRFSSPSPPLPIRPFGGPPGGASRDQAPRSLGARDKDVVRLPIGIAAKRRQATFASRSAPSLILK
jgi:hypothetical protein